MKLQIITANTYNCASDEIMSVLSQVDKHNLDNHYIVIVPNIASIETEKQLINTISGSFNIQVLSLNRLADKLLGNFDFITKQASIMLIYKLTIANKDKLTCYKHGFNNRGFAESMYEVITQLKFSNIKPSQLSLADLDVSMSGKLADIKLIYNLYQDYLSNCLDTGEQLDKLTRTIEKNSYITNCFFYFKDFDNFSLQEIEIIKKFCMYSKGVTVAATYNIGQLNNIYHQLINMSKANNIAYSIKQIKSCNNIVASAIEYQFNKLSSKCLISANDLMLYEASNAADEVEHLFKYIISLIRNNGWKYKHIVVISPNLSDLSILIGHYSLKYEVPIFIDNSTILTQHSLTQFVIDFLSMKSTNYAANNINNYIKNFFFDCEAASVQALDILMKQYNLSHTLLSCDTSSDIFTNSIAAINKLKQLIREFPIGSSVSDYIQCCRKIINNNIIKKRLAELAGIQAGLNNNLDSTQIIDKLNQILDQMDKLLYDCQLTLDQFIKMLISACDSVKISVSPKTSDCLMFVPLEKSRVYDYKAIAILGAVQDKFPNIKSDVRLLSDKDIDYLARRNLDVQPSIRNTNLISRFNIYQLLMQAKNTLYVSYSNSYNGQAESISSVMLSLSKIFSLDTNKDYPIYNQYNSPYRDIITCTSSVSALINDMRNYIDNLGKLRLNALYSVNNNAISYIYSPVELDKINCGIQLFSNKLTTSVSKIESFYTCPYKHFLKYGLKIEPLKISRFEPNDLGTIIHAVIEQYTRIYLIENESDQTTRLKANSIFDNIMANGIEQLSQQYLMGLRRNSSINMTFESVRNECAVLCIAIRKQIENSKYKPKFFELTFDKDIKIDDNLNIKFIGKIDRIDTYGNQSIIIDYKSGSLKSINETNLFRGNSLQLFTYPMALSKLNLNLSGVFYVMVSDKYDRQPLQYVGRLVNNLEIVCDIETNLNPSTKSNYISGLSRKIDGNLSISKTLISSQQLEQYIELAIVKVKQACKRIFNGEISVYPIEQASCKYCPYKNICHNFDLFSCQSEKITVNADDICNYLIEVARET